MKTKKVFLSFMMAFYAVMIFASPKANLKKTDERFLWVITGTDKNGNESKVYIQGTVHVATTNTCPLSDNVLKIFDEADRHVSEMSSSDYHQIQEVIQQKTLESAKKTGLNFLSLRLTPEEQEFYKTLADEVLKEEVPDDKTARDVAFLLLNRCEPWVSVQIINAYLLSKLDLNRENGIELQFYTRLENAGKEWDGLDSLETQVNVLLYGTYDEQLVLFKDSLHEAMDLEKTKEELNRMMTAYSSDDLDGLAECLLEDDKEKSSKNKKLYKKYNKVLITDRNKAWIKLIKNYLDQGGTTFIFAGAAHFLGDDSVFVHLKKAKIIE